MNLNKFTLLLINNYTNLQITEKEAFFLLVFYRIVYIDKTLLPTTECIVKETNMSYDEVSMLLDKFFNKRKFICFNPIKPDQNSLSLDGLFKEFAQFNDVEYNNQNSIEYNIEDFYDIPDKPINVSKRKSELLKIKRSNWIK